MTNSVQPNQMSQWEKELQAELLSILMYGESSGILLLIFGLFNAVDEFHTGENIGQQMAASYYDSTISPGINISVFFLRFEGFVQKFPPVFFFIPGQFSLGLNRC